MTKEELITKQQLKIEDYEIRLKENKILKDRITRRFYNIGEPLNDNVLKMNKDQIKWCFEIIELVEQINS